MRTLHVTVCVQDIAANLKRLRELMPNVDVEDIVRSQAVRSIPPSKHAFRSQQISPDAQPPPPAPVRSPSRRAS